MSLNGATVLILEDEPIIGLALEDILSREGASVSMPRASKRPTE